MIARLPDTPRLRRLVGDLMAHGASQAAAKASRLFVVIAMARTLDATAIGLAATAIAASEILKALTENGIGQRIIAAAPEDLDSVCITAQRLFRLWCGGLFVFQALVGAAFLGLGGDPMVAAMIVLLGLEYLFMPAGLVSCFLAMREGRMRSTAAVGGAQVVLANLATAPLLLLWPSPMAVVVPKVLSAPLWTLGMRRLRPWRAVPGTPMAPVRPFLGFGAAVLGVELLKAVRLQADKLIVGGLLGIEALGLWFFAFNAGLGLANALSVAFSTIVFPHFCRAANGSARDGALRDALLLGGGLVAPAILVQALLAPVYVPLVFGPGWAGVAPLVAILCLAALPGIAWTAASQWLRAHGLGWREFRGTFWAALAMLAALTAAAPFGLEAAAIAYVAAAVLAQGLLTLHVLRRPVIAILPHPAPAAGGVPST